MKQLRTSVLYSVKNRSQNLGNQFLITTVLNQTLFMSCKAEMNTMLERWTTNSVDRQCTPPPPPSQARKNKPFTPLPSNGPYLFPHIPQTGTMNSAAWLPLLRFYPFNATSYTNCVPFKFVVSTWEFRGLQGI